MNRFAVLACGFVAACNYDTGECYLRDGRGAGAGGGIVTPGSGGFGDVPPEPQGAEDPTPPECKIATQSPCYEKCQADYEAAATACTKIVDAAQKRSCDEGAYAAYKSCRGTCQQTANTDCDDKYQDCVDNGPTKCLKKSAGKTVCYRCWERCNAGDGPSAGCRDCKF